MTVMVTGASGPVGRALVPLLVRRDEVRAAVRDPSSAEPLRRMGAKTTVGRLDDADSLAEVLGGVFTLIHLVAGPDRADDDELLDAVYGSTVRAVAASKEAGVRRIVFASVPGASADASGPFLRAKGLAEEAVIASGLQHAVIRSAPVVGTGSVWFAAVVAGALASPPIAWGEKHHRLAPVAVGDLAAVLAVADDLDVELAGTWGLEGSDVVTADGLVEMLIGSPAGTRHLEGDAARIHLSALFERPVSDHLVEAVCAPARADAPDASSFFGIERTPLADAMREAVASAATDADAGG
ncbi:MAG: SDR family oxidoreductase [Actinomycetota bacterium]